MARCTRVAATALSTPPLSPQMTCPSGPTVSWIWATVSSMKWPGVQSPAQPQMPRTKFPRMRLPRGVCTTSGWNWMP